MDLKQEYEQKLAVLREDIKSIYAKEAGKIRDALRSSFVKDVIDKATKRAEEIADEELELVKSPDPPVTPALAPPQNWTVLDDTAKNDAPAIVAIPKKSRRRKVTKGFTPSEKLAPMVMGLLVQYGPMKKSKIVFELLKEEGVLNDVDLEKHPDGRYRFYKTLDRVRKQLIRSDLIVAKKGVWDLAPVEVV